MRWEPFPIKGRTNAIDLEWLYELGRRFHTVVEVGGGRSTFALLAGNFSRWGHDGKVYCVDCWPTKIKGTHDEFNYEDKDILRRGEFMLVNGNFPNLNTIEIQSELAVRLFDRVGAVFLDGGTHNMLKDAAIWEPKAKKVLSGHDYSEQYPKVMMGLAELFGSRLQLVGGGSSVWWVGK